MPRLLLAQLRHRPGRAAALGLAILVTAASFTLLTASSRTSTLRVRSTVTRNFRGAYDILVRPKGSFTPLERRRGLVRDNYLSGIYGGITRRQYATIARLPGVEVAAPIANIGTVLISGAVKIPLARFLDGARDQLFRAQFVWHAQRGLSRYPGGADYVYVTRRRFWLWNAQSPYSKVVVSDRGHSQPLPPCEGFGGSRPVAIAPFAPVDSTTFECYSFDLSPQVRAVARKYGEDFDPHSAVVSFSFGFALNLAAIDPVQEARLVHLDRAVVRGRYLGKRDRPRPARGGLVVPVLASSRTFVDERLSATVERLSVPRRADVPALLAAGACARNVVPCDAGLVLKGPRGETAYRFVTGLRSAAVLARRSFPAASAYAAALAGGGLGGLRRVFTDAYWTSSPVRYRLLGPHALRPLPVTNSDETWLDDFNGDTSYFEQPTDNRDVQFRHLTERRASNELSGNALLAPAMRPVGEFDPARLPGFSRLSQVPLETYYPPRLEPADARTARLLHGKTLLPTGNVADYVAQPPLLLTTLAGLAPFLDSSRWSNLSPHQQAAPISVVRVRVAGVTGPDALSRERIRTVAQLIHDRTGLDVDVTAGSSPTPVEISLPAGKFGRPPLLLREGWVDKGVAVSYLRALDRKDVALYALILVVCALFLGNGALASVRGRRSELGTLSTLGWSRAEIFRLVLGELALVGVVAGLVGTALAAVLAAGLGLDLPLARTLYVLPTGVALALAAGSVPAWRAARGRPLDAILPSVAGEAGARRVRGIAGLALVNLRRCPGRTAVGAAGLVAGVAALTLLVGIERGFRGTLVGTVLGHAVSLQVRGADFVAIGLTVALAALSAADVLYLNVRERRAELVTLATLGWSDAELRRLLGLEAVLLAAGASALGAGLGLAVGALLLGVGSGALAAAAALSGAAATGATVAASALPALRLRRLAAPQVLAAE